MLFIISPLETAADPRGTRTSYILNWARLRRSKALLITSDFDHSKKQRLDPEIIKKSNPIETIVLHAPGYTENISVRRVLFQIVFTLKALIVILKRAHRDDAVLTMLSFPELTLINLFAKIVRGCHNVVDVWDIWPDALVSIRRTPLTRVFSLYCNTIYRLTLPHMNRVFYVAPRFTQWAHRFGVTSDKLCFVPLGYDSSRWDSLTNDNYNHVLSGEPLRLTYVGYLAEQFDLSPLLDSLKISSSINLTILGDGPYFDLYRRKAAGKPVTFTGNASFNEVEKALKRSSIGVLPIANGGCAELPNKLFDYIGAGVPILVIGGCDAGQLVKDEGIGWHIPQDINSINSFILNLTREDIACKKVMLTRVRNRFTKDALYPPMLRHIEYYC